MLSLTACSVLPEMPRSVPTSLSPASTRAMGKGVEIIQSFSDILPSDDAAQPKQVWHMRLERMHAMIHVRLDVLGLMNFYVTLGSLGAHRIGSH